MLVSSFPKEQPFTKEFEKNFKKKSIRNSFLKSCNPKYYGTHPFLKKFCSFRFTKQFFIVVQWRGSSTRIQINRASSTGNQLNRGSSTGNYLCALIILESFPVLRTNIAQTVLLLAMIVVSVAWIKYFKISLSYSAEI